MRIAVAGASGFIGRRLVAALGARGDAVVSVSLRDPAAAARACDGSDAVVNLAGEPVAQRWSAAVKARIRASRVDAPRAFIAALGALERRPQVYVSASAIGYYGASEIATFTEASPPGDDFLASVCVAWEAEAMRAATAGMRLAIVRNGIVLGTDGGALARLLPIFRLGLGGPVAGGRQWYSWIHIADTIGIYLSAIDGVGGVLNATAPAPVRNAEFTAALARTLHRPAFFSVPAFALRTLFGEGAEPIITGQRVLPERTLASGFRFAYGEIAAAFADLLG